MQQNLPVNILFLIIISYLSSCTQDSGLPQCTVEQKYFAQLDFLDDFLDGSIEDAQMNRVSVIYFLEELTSIESKSSGIPIGKILPTKTEVGLWRDWYHANKSALSISTNCDSIIFSNEIEIYKVQIYFDPEIGRVDVD